MQNDNKIIHTKRGFMIRKIQNEDIAAVCDLYNYYVRHTIVTFEEMELTSEQMYTRIFDVGSATQWLVSEGEKGITGFAYAGQWKPRSAYKNSVESSVYVHHEKVGEGIGDQLYKYLLERLRKQGCHTVVGGIALPNDASIALHEKHGFVKIAHFKEIGFKFDQWIDVGYWQLILD
jgi:phosphinothricin acetyltransferase